MKFMIQNRNFLMQLETEKSLKAMKNLTSQKRLHRLMNSLAQNDIFICFLSFVTLLIFQSTSPDKSSNKGQRKTMNYVKTFVPF